MNKSYNVSTDLPRLHIFKGEGESNTYKSITMSLIIIGGILNFTLIVHLKKKKKLNIHFQYCLWHLCIANIVQYVGFIPYAMLEVRDVSHHLNEIGNYAVCSLVDGITIFFIAAFTSGYMLCYMASTRYFIISQPLKTFKLSIDRARVYVVVFWLISIFLFIPNFFTLKHYGDDPFCLRTYPFGKSFFTWYGLIAFFAGFYLPLVFMSVIYILTIRHLFKKRDETSKARVRHRSQVVVVLGSLVSSFVICWLPISVIWVLSSTGMFEATKAGQVVLTRYYKATLTVSLVAGILNIVVNKVISLHYRLRRRRRITVHETLVTDTTNMRSRLNKESEV